jgi:enamine deaminase RidA (YjgF/YER057c/UK114 family)
MPTEYVNPAALGGPIGMYSHAAAGSGQVVVVAGQVGLNAAGELAGTDIYAQTRQVFANIAAALEGCGCTMKDIARLQTFIVGEGNVADFMRARGDVLPGYYPDGVYPPNTLLVISRLVRPEFLVEIEAMALK